MTSALVIGGTGFVGRHTVANLVDHGYEVASLSRGTQPFRFGDGTGVERVEGDRSDADVLTALRNRIEPDVVIDCAAYHPDDVRIGIDVFADVDAYVYVSSGATYAVQEIPKREDATPLHDCDPDQETDETMATYGPRKAECDRIVTDAADRGVPGMSVRPTVVYGPGVPGSLEPDEPSRERPSWSESDQPANETLHDYWIDRVERFDRVLVPGDGTAIWHRAYVEDVADALRVVAEDGEPGEAYNVGDGRVCTQEDVIELIGDALDTSVDVVHASRRELATADLAPEEFVLYHHPMTGYPHILDTCKLVSLGWESTPVAETMARTVAERLRDDRLVRDFGPDREAEESLLRDLAG